MSSSFTVTERDGCRLIEGSVPLTAFEGLTKGLPRNAVMDLHAARVLGVDMAFGTKERLDALCKQPDVVEAAFQRARKLGVGLDEDAIAWLAIGHQGKSSQTIFQRLTGVRLVREEGHPLDPSDFGRCRRLMEEVPSLGARREELSAISPEWARLVENWQLLCEEMDREAPNWRSGVGSSPSTYKHMKAILAEAAPAG